MIESVQELQTPSIVLNTKEEFEKTYQLLHTYLDTIAVVYCHDVQLLKLSKMIEGEKIKIRTEPKIQYVSKRKSHSPVMSGIFSCKQWDLVR